MAKNLCKEIRNNIFEFPIDIYHRKLWIAVGADVNDLNKLFPEGDTIGDPFREVNGYVAVTDRVRKVRPEMLGGILIRFCDATEITFENVTHESSHAALFIFSFIGATVDAEHQETFAYLAGYISKCIGIVKEKLYS